MSAQAAVKLWVCLIVVAVLSGCRSKTTNHLNLDASSSPARAIYLTHGPSELSSEELKAHPEVIVVQDFDGLKKYASQKIALWIDKSATPFNTEQEAWINDAPQAYAPIVLVGYSDTLYSFRDLLRLCCFMGPPIDWPPEPGFSVLQWKTNPDPEVRTPVFLYGYPQKPNVAAILEITNALLEGKLISTPVPELPKATATVLP